MNLKRGEVWLVNLGPGRGSEQAGIRPALVIQNDVGNRYASTTVVAAVTSTIRKYPVTVVLAKGEAGLEKASMVNLAQLLTVDKKRLRTRLGSVRSRSMKAVDEAIRLSLGV